MSHRWRVGDDAVVEGGIYHGAPVALIREHPTRDGHWCCSERVDQGRWNMVIPEADLRRTPEPRESSTSAEACRWIEDGYPRACPEHPGYKPEDYCDRCKARLRPIPTLEQNVARVAAHRRAIYERDGTLPPQPIGLRATIDNIRPLAESLDRPKEFPTAKTGPYRAVPIEGYEASSIAIRTLTFADVLDGVCRWFLKDPVRRRYVLRGGQGYVSVDPIVEVCYGGREVTYGPVTFKAPDHAENVANILEGAIKL